MVRKVGLRARNRGGWRGDDVVLYDGREWKQFDNLEAFASAHPDYFAGAAPFVDRDRQLALIGDAAGHAWFYRLVAGDEMIADAWRWHVRDAEAADIEGPPTAMAR